MNLRQDAVIVLGGSLINDVLRGWRTTYFNEGDLFGALGDRWRVVAGSIVFLSADKNNKFIILAGGRGQLRGIAGAPTVSSVLKKELIELGVPQDDIVEDDRSDNSYEQLRNVNSIIGVHVVRHAVLISNCYHLPRVRVMIEHLDDLEYLRIMLASGDLDLLGAENICRANDAALGAEFDRIYSGPTMQARIDLEERGILDIRAGRYKLPNKWRR